MYICVGVCLCICFCLYICMFVYVCVSVCMCVRVLLYIFYTYDQYMQLSVNYNIFHSHVQIMSN